jgi:hypothetical protein
MGFRSEVFVLVFGVLLILVTFGDNHLGSGSIALGNLDTIFGLTLWPVMDLIYPVATVAVFLLYGWSKRGSLKINAATTLLFASFLLTLSLMNVDDIAIGLNHPIELPHAYWAAISWVYPLYAASAFFLFGKLHEEKKEPIQPVLAFVGKLS